MREERDEQGGEQAGGQEWRKGVLVVKGEGLRRTGGSWLGD